MTEKEKIFAKRLIESLDEIGMTQRELSKKINISETTISKYVKGRLPKAEILEAIASALNKSTDYLLGNDKPTIIKEFGSVIYVPVLKDIKFNDILDDSNPNIIKWLPVAKERFANCNTLFYKEVQDNEMNPLLIVGDLVLFEVVRPGIDKIHTGDICLCTKGNENAVIREMVNTCCGYVFNLMNVSMPPRAKSLDNIKTEDINILARALEFVHIFPDRGSNND